MANRNSGNPWVIGEKLLAADLNDTRDGLVSQTEIGVGVNKIPRLDSSGKLPSMDGSALTSMLISLIASDNLKYSADTEGTVGANSNTYQIKKQITVRNKGTVRVKYDFKNGTGTTYHVYGRIYVNGVAVGIERNVFGNTNYTTYSEDITINAYDLVQFYMHGEVGASDQPTVRNFRIYYDKTNPADGTVDMN